jgi:hypothetical protein
MLIEEPHATYPDPILALVARVNNNPTQNVQERPGVYRTGHFGSSHWPTCSYREKRWNHYPEFEQGDEGPYRGCYGVCDNLQQVLDLYPELEAPDRKFLIQLTEVRRENQSPEGGWRWHKWGPYIGTFKSEHEYLYHEVGIEAVLVFHLYELVPASQKD